MSIDILQDKIRRVKNPTILTLEPVPELLPPCILREQPSGIAPWEVFYGNILEALKEKLPGVRVNLPGFLCMGAEGLSLMSRLLKRARELGYYVILDGIPDSWGTVGEMLVQAVWGEDAQYPCDAVVVNGYLGTDTMKPFLPYCKEGKALFVLAKSPNPSSIDVQDLALGGRVVHTAMGDLISRWGFKTIGKSGYQQVGAVIGAPYTHSMITFRTKYDRIFTLITGLEVSNASPKGCSNAFDRLGHGAAVCAAGYILGAWAKGESDGTDYVERAVEAAERLKKNLAKNITIL